MNDLTDKISTILRHYGPPEMEFTANCRQQVKRHRRPRINKKWRKRYGFHAWSIPIERYEIVKYNKKPFIESYYVNAILHPSKTSQIYMPYYSAPLSAWSESPIDAVGPAFETEIIELKMFGYAQTVRKAEIFYFLNQMDDIKARLYDSAVSYYQNLKSLSK
jgi:hypothetical protein